MEILWWLAPAVVVMGAAMVWVSWVGRKGYGAVDPEVAAERLGRALEKDLPTPRRTAPVRQTHQPSTGVAVRPSQRSSGLFGS